MSADVLLMRRPRRPFPIPVDACRILNLTGSDFVHQPVSYALRRRRDGVHIMFSVVIGPRMAFSWTVGADKGLRSFDEARAWVRAYAARYGNAVEEIVKERTPRPKGADAKLLKAGGCAEAWLSHDNPVLWAEAMVRCRHPAGYCGQDGYCHYGDCDMAMSPEAASGDDGGHDPLPPSPDPR